MAWLHASRRLGLGRQHTGAALLVLSALIVLAVLGMTDAPAAAWDQATRVFVEPVGLAALLGLAVALAVAGNALVRQARPWLRGPQPLPGGGRLSWLARLVLAGAAFTALWIWLREHVNDVLVVGVLTVVGLLTWYSGHRLLLARLARRPGPLAIYDVEDATGGEDKQLVSELTPTLRRYLAQVDLYPQAVLPGAAEPTGFVEMVQTASGGSTLFERVTRFLLALIPSHAYAVHCTAMRREGPQPCGVAVQLQLRPRWMSAPKVHWGRTYDEALFLGACGIAETILPWTRQGTKPPWTGWMDDQMPPGLVADYVRSTKLVEQRRYDEAAGALRSALRKDPTNLQLRLDLAHVYQRMALWMDALELYAYVIDLAEQQLKAAPMIALRRKARAHKTALRAQRTLARYRRTILLAWGDQLAHQWMKRDPESRDADPKRRDEKRRIRQRSAEHLMALLARRTSSALRTRAERERFEEQVRTLLTDPPHSAWKRPRKPSPEGDHLPEVALHLLFQLLAHTSAHDHQVRRWWDRLVRPHRVLVTRTSWRMLQQWTRYRLVDTAIVTRYLGATAALKGRYLELDHPDALAVIEGSLTVVDSVLPPSTTGAGLTTDDQVLEARRAAAARITATVATLVSSADKVRGSWLDHYNAACTYLAPLALPEWPLVTTPWTTTEPWTPTEERWIAAAVDHLRAAMRRRRPSDVALLMPWVCSEDPDLAPARNHPLFATFAARHFPGTVTYHRRPASVHVFELSLYTNQATRRLAAMKTDWWRARKLEPAPEGRDLVRILSHDETCWRALSDMARDYKHWPTRLVLVQTLYDWLADEGLPCEEMRYPAFDEYHHLIAGTNGQPQGIDADMVTKSSRRFDQLLTALDGVQAMAGATKAVREAVAGEPSPVDHDAWQALIRDEARAWNIVAEWLDHEALRREPPSTSYIDQLSTQLAALADALHATARSIWAEPEPATDPDPAGDLTAAALTHAPGLLPTDTVPGQRDNGRLLGRPGW